MEVNKLFAVQPLEKVNLSWNSSINPLVRGYIAASGEQRGNLMDKR
jgi:hypothetical protein